MSRNIDFKSEPFAAYAKALGEAVLVWNDLGMVLSDLFAAATKIPNKLAPDAIWNALKSDRSQREITEAMIDLSVIGYKIPNPLRSEIKWLFAEFNKLEDLRNSFVHSPILVDEKGDLFAWHQLGNKRAKRLSGKNLNAELVRFYNTIVILRQHTEILTDALRWSRVDLPPRPSLPVANSSLAS